MMSSSEVFGVYKANQLQDQNEEMAEMKNEMKFCIEEIEAEIRDMKEFRHIEKYVEQFKLSFG